MAPVVTDIQTPVPPSELAILEAHLPYSYSLLRRCQFTHRPRGTSPHAHYLFASDPLFLGGATGSLGTDRGDHGATPTTTTTPTTDTPTRHFAAAYVDLSKGPETEVFFYSTLQDHAADGDGDTNDDDDGDDRAKKSLPLSSLLEEEVEHVLDLIISLFRRIKEIAAAAAATANEQGEKEEEEKKEKKKKEGFYALHRPQGPMVGGLHEGTYQLLLRRRGVRSSYWNPHDVWLFRLDRLRTTTTTTTTTTATSKLKSTSMSTGNSLDNTHHHDADANSVSAATAVEEGKGEEGPWGKLGFSPPMRWDVVRREDVPLIASRTKIPKVEATLMSEPSVVVRDGEGDGILVAWGFMGIAGTLSTLHVEEPYRGRGLAKALAIKVLKEHSFGDDGWGSADVHVDNVQSQGVCKSLGGRKGIRTCWTVIDYDSIP